MRTQKPMDECSQATHRIGVDATSVRVSVNLHTFIGIQKKGKKKKNARGSRDAREQHAPTIIPGTDANGSVPSRPQILDESMSGTSRASLIHLPNSVSHRPLDSMDAFVISSMARMAATGSLLPYTAEPATMTFAPAAAHAPTVSRLTPPST